jgi:ferritin
MAMSEQLRDAFNEQIALEFSAAYTYLAMAAYFDEQNLTGMAHWMTMQHEEELVHARKFFQFMLDRDAGVHLGAIPEPRQDYGSPVEAFEAALAHEQKVSAAIHALYRTADAEGDYTSMPLLSWFIDEQLEEEASVGRILDRVKLAGDNAAALLVLDREMETRGGAGGDEG